MPDEAKTEAKKPTRKPRKASAFRVLPVSALDASIGSPATMAEGCKMIDAAPDGDYAVICIRAARSKATVNVAQSKPLKL